MKFNIFSSKIAKANDSCEYVCKPMYSTRGYRPFSKNNHYPKLGNNGQPLPPKPTFRMITAA